MADARGYLVVRADGTMRVTKSLPRLRWDEFAFPVHVTIPVLWGHVLATKLTGTLPEPQTPEIDIGAAQTGEP